MFTERVENLREFNYAYYTFIHPAGKIVQKTVWGSAFV